MEWPSQVGQPTSANEGPFAHWASERPSRVEPQSVQPTSATEAPPHVRPRRAQTTLANEILPFACWGTKWPLRVGRPTSVNKALFMCWASERLPRVEPRSMQQLSTAEGLSTRWALARLVHLSKPKPPPSCVGPWSGLRESGGPPRRTKAPSRIRPWSTPTLVAKATLACGALEWPPPVELRAGQRRTTACECLVPPF